MDKPEWVNYSGAAPILLPVRMLQFWQGFYLPATPDDELPDLVLADGDYTICDDFDFDNPQTDYDRACALDVKPAVQEIKVGPGYGLVFATEHDQLTWWPEQRLVVNGGCLPEMAKLPDVQWTEELVWLTTESDFVLMNACDHGANPEKDPYLAIHLEPGRYLIQTGEYGGAEGDSVLLLFRFDWLEPETSSF